MSIGDRMNDFEPEFVVSPCDTCARKLTPFTCEAFPEEIPMVFVAGDNWHTEPYFGDGGLQYVRDPNE